MRTPAQPATRRAWVEQIMGMPISIHLRGGAAPPDRLAAVEAAFAELREVDRVFSTYRAESEISRLDRGELAIEECSPVVREVLDLCEQARAATGGYFDIRLPDRHGKLKLDPSGLVKGWAAERAARHLRQLGSDDHYLNAGGDIALRCVGLHSPPWRIGVEHPDRPGELLGVLPLRRGGIATSGTAQRGEHIVDPTTGRPATALRSVTVIGPSLLWADVYATAAFARGADGFDWLAGQDGYDALVVRPDGTVETTPGMGALLQPTP
jgi:thiamine biosynthesis lipoprotein